MLHEVNNVENCLSVGINVWPSFGQCPDDTSSVSCPGFLVLDGSDSSLAHIMLDPIFQVLTALPLSHNCT